MSGRVSLLLVDDDTLVRAGIRLLFERLDCVSVVGEASNGREALFLIDKLRPDIVLTDIVMPVVDGITLTREVRQRYPTTAVVVLTGYDDDVYLSNALN